MYPVGLGQGGHIRPIVDDQERRCPASQLPQSPGMIHEFAVGQPLVAQLKHVHASGDQPLGHPLKLLDT